MIDNYRTRTVDMRTSFAAAGIAILTILAAFGAAAQEKANLPSEVTLFKNVNVFNGVDGKSNDQDVLVVHNKIHKIDADIPEAGTWEIEMDKRAKTREIPPAIGDYTGGYTFMLEIAEGPSMTVYAAKNIDLVMKDGKIYKNKLEK